MTEHRSIAELESALSGIAASPADRGSVDMIVARPGVGERVLLDAGELDEELGLVSDGWTDRGSRSTADGSSDPEEQLTIINTRLIDAVAGAKSRWQLAGDQLVIDIDLSHDNLPPGSRLKIGSAVVELTAKPHTGCAKFAGRFGHDALRFVSTKEAMRLRLRGANAKVIHSGAVRVGDVAVKLG